MKIGISTSVIQRGRGGIGQYLFALLRGLSITQPNQEFALFVLEDDRELFSFLNDQFQIVPVREKHRPAVANILWHQRELPRLCRELQLDVIHVPSYRRLLWSAPCARVATIHDLAPFRVSGKYDLARMFYGRVVVKHLARRQEKIIAVSHNTASDIEQFFGIPRSEVRVIHNGLEHERFFPRAQPSAQKHVSDKFGLSKPYLLYVARLEHPGKNHVRLIEAFEEFKQRNNSPVELAFGGSDWHGAEVIHARASTSPFRNQIHLLGFVRDDDLPFLYSAADAFVYPSLYEGFGMPPVEAMACACPVICSDRGSLGEVVADAALIIDPEDSSSISAALTRIGNPAERERLIREGLARARGFSWEKAAAQTFEVYESALALCSESARTTQPWESISAGSVEK